MYKDSTWRVPPGFNSGGLLEYIVTESGLSWSEICMIFQDDEAPPTSLDYVHQTPSINQDLPVAYRRAVAYIVATEPHPDNTINHSRTAILHQAATILNLHCQECPHNISAANAPCDMICLDPPTEETYE